MANQGNTNTEIGIIAQELESILPNSIKIDETTNAKSLKSNDEIFWHKKKCSKTRCPMEGIDNGNQLQFHV